MIERILRALAEKKSMRFLMCFIYTLYALPRNFFSRLFCRALKSGPLVSVVIPVACFDKAHEKMMRSVMKQRYRDLEILEIDDTAHEGAGKARNRGLDKAKGKYLLFLDADDFFEPNFIGTLVSAAEKGDHDVTMCFSDRYEGAFRLFSPMNWRFVSEPLFTPTVFVKLWRRDFVLASGTRFQEIARSNDAFFSLALAAKATKPKIVKRVLVHYRRGRKTNLQSTNHLSPLAFTAVLEALKPILGSRYESIAETIYRHNLAVNRGLERLEIIRLKRTPRVAFLGAGELGGGSTYVRGKIAELRVDSVEKDPDLYHVNHLRALLKLVFNPFRSRKIPIVFVLHGLHLRKYDFLPKTLSNRLRRFLRFNLERYLYSKIDEMIVLNPSDLSRIENEYKVKCRVELIPNTPPLSAVASAEADPTLTPTHHFLMLARFDFPKGQDILLKAISKVQAELRAQKRRVLFIGDGETVSAMKRLAEVEGVTDLVDFAGAVPEGARELYRGKILIAPSRWEGSPFAVLEAMAQKKSLILSDCPGNFDVAKAYDKANFFKTADIDELSRLLVSDSLR